LHLGLRASHGLYKRKQQGQVGMDTTPFQFSGGGNTLPGGRHLDQNPVDMDALGLVQFNQALGPTDGGTGIKTQARIHLGRHPPGNDGQNLAAKTHQQAVHDAHQGARDRNRDTCLRHQGPVFSLLDRLENQ
jgi:hypothetical protein